MKKFKMYKVLIKRINYSIKKNCEDKNKLTDREEMTVKHIHDEIMRLEKLILETAGNPF